jgi:HSP20 family molecular chaperone IbpA
VIQTLQLRRTPKVDVIESKTHHYALVTIPGVDPVQIKVIASQSQLTIYGERPVEFLEPFGDQRQR